MAIVFAVAVAVTVAVAVAIDYAVVTGFQLKINSNNSETASTHPTIQPRGCNWLLLVLGWLPNLYNNNISKTMLFEALCLIVGGGPFKSVVTASKQLCLIVGGGAFKNVAHPSDGLTQLSESQVTAWVLVVMWL